MRIKSTNKMKRVKDIVQNNFYKKSFKNLLVGEGLEMC
jgi:hypothetical protein